MDIFTIVGIGIITLSILTLLVMSNFEMKKENN